MEGMRREAPETELKSHHATAALAMYREFREGALGESSERLGTPESADKILTAITENALEHSDVFTSRDGTAFPFTKVDLAAVVRSLLPSAAHAASGGGTDKEFVFVSTGAAREAGTGGNQFVFFEEVLHQIILRLPAALESVQEGGPIEDYAAYVMGTPSNKYGHISDAMQASLAPDDANAFAELAKPYAEFVGNELATTPSAHVRFQGFSMGSSMAAETAKRLIDTGAVTQNIKGTELPRLQVRLDVPAGYGTLSPGHKSWQVPLGFFTDVGREFITNPYIWTAAFAEAPFLNEVEKRMEKKGIAPDLSETQLERKAHLQTRIIENLRSGMPFPDDVRTTQVIGRDDLTMFTRDFHDKARDQGEMREMRDGKEQTPLGAAFVPNDSNQRIAGPKMGHTVPFFRDNELRRIGGAAYALDKVQGKA